MVCITRKGKIKKTKLSEFDTSRKNGLIAVNLNDGDSLVSIKRTAGNSELVIVTKYGKSITFHEDEVRPMGRNAAGVKAIELEGDDEVVGMEIKKSGEELLVVSSMGFGKRTQMKEYKAQNRGGKGVLTYDKAKIKKTGVLVGALAVKENDEIMLINSDGIIIRMKASEISKLGRATQGVKVMRVNENETIISIAKMENSEEEANEQLKLDI